MNCKQIIFVFFREQTTV